MQFLAFNTDQDAEKKEMLSVEEKEVISRHYHWMSFMFSVVPAAFMTVLLLAACIYTSLLRGWPHLWIWGVAAVLWLIFGMPRFVRAFLDWYGDMIFVTTDKLVLFDQTSIFKRKVTPINLEYVASVSAETQFWNLFGFGILHLHLTEVLGGKSIILKYIPKAETAAAKIADAVTQYQRRKDLRRHTHIQGLSPEAASTAAAVDEGTSALPDLEKKGKVEVR